MLTIDEELDVRGLNCPMPIIRTRHSLKHLSVGQHLKIIATDPGTVRDFEALCGHTGNKLVVSESENGEYIFIIKKTAENKQTANG